jgi:flagellar basal body rod protein FlgG
MITSLTLGGPRQYHFLSGLTDGAKDLNMSCDSTESRVVSQFALATVTNPVGLIASGNNNYETTAASGEASVGVAGTGGRGMIDGGALEQSNVKYRNGIREPDCSAKGV